MSKLETSILRNPYNDHNLYLSDENSLKDSFDNVFPIINNIPRFVPSDNYSSSFGMQWNIFAKTQLDSFANTTITEDRFFRVTEWKKSELKDSLILEAGSGAGRFTEIIAKSGAILHSVDYSSAINANFANDGHFKNLQLYQASIYDLLFKPNTFDKIVCLGVIQHTPDVKKSFFSLLPFLKQGGEIAIDVYKDTWKSRLLTKHWVRPITKKMDKRKLLKIIQTYIPIWFPISTLFLKVPIFGKFLCQIIPICNYSNQFPDLSKE